MRNTKTKFIKFLILGVVVFMFGFASPANAQIQYDLNSGFDSGNDGTIDEIQYGAHGNQTQYTITDNSQRPDVCRSLKSGHVVFSDIISFVNCTISTTIIPLLMSLAVLVFIWGIIQYVIAQDDEGKRKSAKDTILYGIIGLFVMISIWGLVKILGNTFGVENTIPTLTEPQ